MAKTAQTANNWADLTPLSESSKTHLRQFSLGGTDSTPLADGRFVHIHRAAFIYPVFNKKLSELVVTVWGLTPPKRTAKDIQQHRPMTTAKLLVSDDGKLYPWRYDSLTAVDQKNLILSAVRFVHHPMSTVIDVIKQASTAQQVEGLIAGLEPTRGTHNA